jgi:hypothetical protein
MNADEIIKAEREKELNDCLVWLQNRSAIQDKIDSLCEQEDKPCG